MTFAPEKENSATGPVNPASAALYLFGRETPVNSKFVSSMITQQMAFVSMATAFNVVMARQFSNMLLSAWGPSAGAADKSRVVSVPAGSAIKVVKNDTSFSKLRIVVENVPVQQKPIKDAKPASKSAEVAQTSVLNGSSVDDLKRISGIGPKLETILKSKGINRFADMARLSVAKASKLDAELGLGGRVSRDQWVVKAKALAKEQA